MTLTEVHHLLIVSVTKDRQVCIGEKEIDPLSKNLVVEKPLQKRGDEVATLKSLFFSLILCMLLHSVLKAGILL